MANKHDDKLFTPPLALNELDASAQPGAGATQPVQPSTPAPGATSDAPAAPPRLMSFGIYFQSLGKPAHHAAGMVKFAPTKYPRTKEDWDRTFAAY